jgi:hypothetical protein
MADPFTLMLMSQAGKKAVGGATATLGGVVQLATGLSQLRKANRLPFPDYREGSQYAMDTKRLYEENFKTGLGQEKMDMMRQNVGAQNIQTYRSIAENAPQLAGAYGRVGAFNQIANEKAIAQMNQSFKESQLAGLTRANAELSTIERRAVAAERQYKMQAEQAAGAAIKTGSENLMRGAALFSGADILDPYSRYT